VPPAWLVILKVEPGRRVEAPAWLATFGGRGIGGPKARSRYDDGAPRGLRRPTDSRSSSGKSEGKCAAARHPHRYQSQILRDLPGAKGAPIVAGDFSGDAQSSHI